MVRHDPLEGLSLLERGWLSSNNLVIHPVRGEAGATLVDAGHVNHSAQTVALLERVLGRRAQPARAADPAAASPGAQAQPLPQPVPVAAGEGVPLVALLNTHLHSDHCGGNAAVQAAFGAPLWIPPGQADAVAAWDERLNFVDTGQRIERFCAQHILRPGEPWVAGGREWQVLAAPGHDPDSVMLFDADAGVLVSADALWENGFGVVFPEVLGGEAFGEVAQVLEAIARLPVRVVVPGHGRAFGDVADALDRARSRLKSFVDDPNRHARYAVKVMLKYHLMEEGEQDLPALLAWAEAVPLLQCIWRDQRPTGVNDLRAWLIEVLEDLARGGALRRDGDRVIDGG